MASTPLKPSGQVPKVAPFKQSFCQRKTSFAPSVSVTSRVLCVERVLQDKAVWPTDVVGAGERQESTGSLTRTRGVDVLELQLLGDDLRVADEVVGVLWIRHQRIGPERHRVAQRQIASIAVVVVTAFTLCLGGDRTHQKQHGGR